VQHCTAARNYWVVELWLVTQHKKFMLKFHHITKLHKVPGTFLQS